MAKRSKKYLESSKNVDPVARYTFEEAVDIVLRGAYANFNESVDVAVRLGVDPRKADQMVRGSVVLPHGTGREIRILAFAKGEKHKEAEEAGADFVGAEDMVEKIEKGWLEFDKAVATPDMMSTVGKLGRILGPRGLMPNAKVGTVTFEIGKAIKELKAGKIEFRVEKTGVIHSALGKVSFGPEKILENLRVFMDALVRHKPASSKGTYFRGIALSSTMGPGVKVDPAQMRLFM